MTLYVPRYQTATVTPTLSTSAMAIGDVVTPLMKFTFKIPTQLGGGLIRGVRIFDKDKKEADLDLYLFNAKPAEIASNAAFALDDTDVKKLIAPALNTPTYVTLTNNSFAIYAASNFPIPFVASKYLYGYLVCTATPTYSSTDGLTVMVDIDLGVPY